VSFKSGSIKFFAGVVRPGAIASSLAFLFKFILRLVPIRKKIASRNLEIALPAKTPQERSAVLRGTYDHLAWFGVEFMTLQRDPAQVLEWVKAVNPEALDDSVGGILLACHVGNWELAASWVAQKGHKMTAIVRESKDIGERDAIADMRKHAGVNFMPKTTPMKRAVSLLRRNEFLGIMPDQYGGSEGIRVPLFGLETSTSQGAAVFAYLTKKPLIPVFTRRLRPFRHLMRFGEPIEWRDKGSRDATIYEITRLVNKSAERMILEAPDQWLAQHRRFREYY
jgi:KDO2-lipid IV(A) lauroyltransferase